MANDFSKDANCVALWRFESGALTTDTIGGNTLTNNNTVTENTSDYKEGSCSADFERGNSEYFSITDADLDANFPLKNGDTNKKISVCGWFRIESLSASTIYYYSKYDTGGKRSFAIIQDGANDLNMNIGYNDGANFEAIELSHNIVVDRWYHFGVTFDNSDKSYKMRLWDDTGENLYEKAGTTTNNINVEDAAVAIGTRANPDEYHDGEMDEVVVFKDILSAAEIDQIRGGTYCANSNLADWGRKCPLVIQSSKVDSNQSNFPVLLTENTLPSEMFDADGSYTAISGGGDIRFSSDSAGDTRLSCEIVTFTTDNDPANGVAEIWTKVPTVSSGTDTTIYVWYNLAGQSQPSEGDAYGKESVWDSNFMMVQHMNDTTTSTITDSTSNNNDGTKAVANNPNVVSGKIGNAQNFDGNDYITVSHTASIDFADEDFTVSIWFKTNTTTARNYMFSKNYGADTVKWYGIDLYVTEQEIACYIDDGTNNCSARTTDDFNDNAWHQIVMQRNTTTNKIISYIDGAWNAEGNDTAGSIANTGDLIIGGRADLEVERFWTDLLDEFHISEGLRSADWIKTEYNNQNDPSTFIIEGTPEAPSGLNIKSINSILWENIKSINGVLRADIKSINGIT